MLSLVDSAYAVSPCSPFFFALHLLDITHRNQTLKVSLVIAWIDECLHSLVCTYLPAVPAC